VTPVDLLRGELARIGYSTIEDEYIFSDVFAAKPLERRVPVAAFTHSPPSFRNAAVAVVQNHLDEAADTASIYRGLGAPLVFVIEGQEVSVWQIHPNARPTLYRLRIGLDQVAPLFSEHRDLWNPGRIHRAKSFGALDQSYQLDFVDIGLIPAIEGEMHEKLDRILSETFSRAVRLRVARPLDQMNERVLFRTVFRLLAAKVLIDKRHPAALLWNTTDIDDVLNGISSYYTLPAIAGEEVPFKGSDLEQSWHSLQRGINFQNISPDTLAFVYENTLITPETRRHFGTHNTPRPVAEYVVSRLGLEKYGKSDLKIYEPFAGAGAFMVAALSALRNLLPIEMPDAQRHRYLVNRIYGDEIDPFAAEVAVLSLILADYPNENGWNIAQADLFKDDMLRNRANCASVVLCNPPFEKFDRQERLRYPEAASRSPQKAIAALDAVLDSQPSAVGFVMPEPFLIGRNFEHQREKVERLYKDIELVALPDGIFKASTIRSSVLIAQTPRSEIDAITNIRSTIVRANDRERFLRIGKVSETRTSSRPMRGAVGQLWVEDLREVWERLADLPRLESVALVHRGIEWEGKQSDAVSAEPREGSSPGIHASGAVHAYGLDEPLYLHSQQDGFRKRTASYNLPWRSEKILANAARISRGPWCFAAAVDNRGLLASQQLFGIWTRAADCSLNTLCAVLNSPVAVAYVASHSPADRIRVSTVRNIPIQRNLGSDLDALVRRYIEILNSHAWGQGRSEIANAALSEIDAAVLASYDLPPRLERRLLDYFRGEQRPTLHHWKHWFPDDFLPNIPLKEYISDQYKKSTSGWVLEIFRPLPEDEVAAVRDYMG
jgi:hypothetical protein